MKHGPACVCTPCCDNEAARDNPIYAAERREGRITPHPNVLCAPGRHIMVPDGRGGGSCKRCPLVIGAEEVQ